MKVTVFLRNDHEALKALFDQFKKPSSVWAQNGKKDCFHAIERELLMHSQMEEEVLIPP